MSLETDMGARLSALRLQKGKKEGRRITQQEAADAVGIGRSTLASYEKGHDKPGRDTMIALAQYYAVPVDHIAGTPSINSDLTPQAVEDPDELALLGFWRALNHDERKLLLTLFEKAIGTNAA
ncbi:helix-turn-helix transcriptional regulator [Gluconacetobacter entanii]|nr:helix-turn-helix transcriptional regulator [Gluconacetobacter entanii]MCE2578086.1 helix-turn-helix transcriptional regulator [Komagataeibacter sp. FNDCR1]